VERKGDFQVEPMCILDWKFKFLRNKSIGIVKVHWSCYGLEDATWENEETMREEYPTIFCKFSRKLNVHLYISVQDSILVSRVPRATSQRIPTDMC
jgi:hypothetical protein